MEPNERLMLKYRRLMLKYDELMVKCDWLMLSTADNVKVRQAYNKV